MHDIASEDLTRALAEDLDTGFADLVRAHQRVLYTVALRVSGSPADAEDLAAEAFLRAYRALRGYDRERVLALNPRSWLLTILLNGWRNTLREAGRRPARADLAEVPDPVSPEVGAPERVERAETSRELGVLVARLPRPQRVAVVLRHVADLPIAEIARVLGMPEGTVKSHVSRGLRRLRAECAVPEKSGESGRGSR